MPDNLTAACEFFSLTSRACVSLLMTGLDSLELVDHRPRHVAHYHLCHYCPADAAGVLNTAYAREHDMYIHVPVLDIYTYALLTFKIESIVHYYPCIIYTHVERTNLLH